MKGQNVIDSYIYKDEDIAEGGFPNQNIIVGWVLRTVAIPNINPHQIMKTTQALMKQAIEKKEQKKVMVPVKETKKVELEKVPESSRELPSEIKVEHIGNNNREDNLLIKLLKEKDEEFEQLKLEYELLNQELRSGKPSFEIQSEGNLGNKERILNLLKSKYLTSNEIAERLSLSKQDTRTYLQRLKAEDKIKVIDKKGRFLVYALKKPISSAKEHYAPESLEYDLSYLLNLIEMKMTPKDGVKFTPIDLMHIKKIEKRIADKKWENKQEIKALRELIDFEKTYKEEIDEKLAELEARVNYIASGVELKQKVIEQKEEEGFRAAKNQVSTEAIYKVIVIGDPAVGKTELLKKFATRAFEERYLPTVGVNILKESINLDDLNATVNLMFWDVPGQPQFYMLYRPYFNGADGMILTFDITRSSTFSNINNWYSTAIKYGLSGIPRILVGIKKELNSEEQRKIILPMAEHLSEKLNAPYFEVSLDTGENVELIFQTIAELVHRYKNGENWNVHGIEQKIAAVPETPSIKSPEPKPASVISEKIPIALKESPIFPSSFQSSHISSSQSFVNYMPQTISSKKLDELRCQYCGYIILKPYPKDQLCPKCRKFLPELYKYVNNSEVEGKTERKQFKTKTSTLSSKFQGKIKVKTKAESFSVEDEIIYLKNEEEYVKFLGITSVERTPLFNNNHRYKYLLELTNNLDYIATSILGGELDKMLLITDKNIEEKCHFYVKDEIIYIVYGVFPDKKGKWMLEQMANYYSELVRGKDVNNLSKLEKSNINHKFIGLLKFMLNEYLGLQEVFTDQEIPYLEDWIRVDYVGLSSMSIGVISLLLDEEGNLNVEVTGEFDNHAEEIEMKESLLTAKIEAIAANTLGNTGSYPRWIAVKLGFQNYRFLTFKRYQNDYFLSFLSEGNLKKIELVEKKVEPYLYYGIDTPFAGNLRPFNKLKASVKDVINHVPRRKFN
ncbi:MAG: GTP-binding protein [Candidatus Hermodarchaeota archaeon]